MPVPDAVPVDGVIEYHEGVHVGYRSWLRLDRTPAAPFGHGLGWTDVGVRRRDARRSSADGSVVLDVTVRNTGARDGREVVQVYVEPPDQGDDRPVRWLGGFAVVHAAAGAHAHVQVRVDARAFRTWDSAQPGWVTPAGTYPIRVGRSSSDLRLTVDVALPRTAPA